jgi:hypothetical protein
MADSACLPEGDDGTDKHLGIESMGWAQHTGRAMSAFQDCWPADRGPWMNGSSVDQAVHLGADLSIAQAATTMRGG